MRAALLLVLLAPVFALAQEPQRIAVPKLWDETALAEWALPVAGLGVPPGFMSSERYYALPVDNLRTYPVYHPSREPVGYREQIVAGGPKPLMESAEPRTEAEWLTAGKRVFEELDIYFFRTADPQVIAHFTDAASVDKYRHEQQDVVTKDGVILGYRWVVDQAGDLQISLSSCAGCHTRVMPDGSVLAGAPRNHTLASSPASNRILAALRDSFAMTPGEAIYAQFGVPWRKHDVNRRFAEMSPQQVGQFMGLENGAPPGATFDRLHGSPFFTTRMADLRGIADRKFLDATATHRNREPADLARYGILVEYADDGVFGEHHMFPAAMSQGLVRPPDETMYALARYLYSLEVPKSPHPMNELARRGQEIFGNEGCKKCHTPPLYTNNELVAVPGFDPPKDDARTGALPVMRRRVDTDPGLALQTRKGTGYYKVPSLRGLWYRGLYEHSGSVRTLEDWFDERRLGPDYEPTGWRGPGVTRRAVPGHEFGLDLEAVDKLALIAFLRTL